MARLRIVLFGTPCGYAEQALRRLAQAHQVVAVVMPGAPTSALRQALRGLTRANGAGYERSARALGAQLVYAAASGNGELEERLRSLRPDLICIALYPRRVDARIAALAPLGAINAHPSLLPRHRGPLPLFWTYHADDREAGVTVHRADDRLDAGEILLQERFTLARGYPVSRLDHDVAARAADLLGMAADALARGSAVGHAQDEAAATHAPLIRVGEPMVRFDEWDVERVWHFLAALCPPYREPLVDVTGRKATYDHVLGYRPGAAGGTPGSVERAPHGLLLHCRGGAIELA